MLDPTIRARVDELVGVGVPTGDAIGIAAYEQQQEGRTVIDHNYDRALADVFGGVPASGYDPGEAYATDPDRTVEYDEDEGRDR